MKKAIYINELTTKILWVLVLSYPFFWIFQGGDLTDTGFFATTFKFFFENLAEGKVGVHTIITKLTGALCLMVFDSILALRALYSLVVVSTSLIVFWGFKRYFRSKNTLLFLILTGQTFAIRWSYLSFDNDVMTMVLLTLVALLVWIGYQQNRKSHLFIAGVLAVLATFSRIPNILILGVPIILLLFSLLNKEQFKLKELSFFYVGFAVMFVTLIWFLFRFLGVEKAIEVMKFDFLPKGNNGYNLHFFTELYKREVSAIIQYSIALFFIQVGFEKLTQFSGKGKTYLLLFFLLLLSYLESRNGYSYANHFRYIFTGFICSIILTKVYKAYKYKKVSVELKIALIVLYVSLVQTVGSNSGLALKMGYQAMLLIPSLWLLIHENRSEALSNNKTSFNKSFIIYVLLFSVLCRYGWVYHVDQGLKARQRSSVKIDSTKYRGIYTSKTNKLLLENVTQDVLNVGGDSTTLYVIGHKPVFYFLTDYRPYISDIWLANKVTTVANALGKIETKMLSEGSKPVLLWFKNDLNELKKKPKLLSAFFEKHHYEKVVGKEKYEIWF